MPKIVIPGEDTNMDELQEIIKPYYLRRVTEDLKGMVDKKVKFLHYNLTDEEKNHMTTFGKIIRNNWKVKRTLKILKNTKS